MRKHQIISNELRAEITAGLYDRDGRLPSESQLVERFGVSRPTVARALRDLCSDGLIERRAGSGSYIRDQATQLNARLLGLLVPGRGSTEVLDLICGEIGALARLHNYGLLWGRSANPLHDLTLTKDLAVDACQQFAERNIRGVIFAPFEQVDQRDKINRSLLDLLQQAGIPVVLLDRDYLAFPLRSDYDLISIDHVQAGYLAADHLLKLGYEKLRFVCEVGSASTVDARLAGVREAMVQHGLSQPKSLRLEGDAGDTKFVRSLARSGSRCAVICGNDQTAARLATTLESLDIRVPEQVAIVGFDDARYATLAPTRLTTVRQPCRDIAELTFRMLEERISDSTRPTRTQLVTPSLVIRESCGAYKTQTRKKGRP